MPQKRRKIDSALKAKVALTAIQEKKTVSEIVSQFEVQANQVSTWKSKVINSLPQIFEDKRSKESQEKDYQKKEDEHFDQGIRGRFSNGGSQFQSLRPTLPEFPGLGPPRGTLLPPPCLRETPTYPACGSPRDVGKLKCDHPSE